VSENRVLARIFKSKTDEVSVVCRNLHNEGLNSLYFSPHVVTTKLKWVEWEIYEIETNTFCYVKVKQSDHEEDLDVKVDTIVTCQ
jgi:hypothetical protein